MTKIVTVTPEALQTKINEGLSDRQLAAFFGCAKNTIVNKRKAYGIAPARAHAAEVGILEADLRRMIEIEALSIKAVAAHYGCNPSVIDRRCAEWVIKSPNVKRAVKITPDLEARVRELFAEGATDAKIGEAVDLSRDRARTVIKKLGLERPVKEKKVKPEKPIVLKAEDRVDVSRMREMIEVEIMPQREVAAHFQVALSVIQRLSAQHGVASPLQDIKRDFSFETLYQMYVDNGMTFVEMGRELGVSNVTVRKRVEEAGIPIRSHSETIQAVLPRMAATKFERHGYYYFPEAKEYRQSRGEKEVMAFLNDLGGDFKPDRKLLGGNLELDMYDVERKLAVEYNGDYYHSEDHKGKYYHKNKQRICAENGVRLIFIAESLWRERKTQVKQYLSAVMGVFERRIGASKCKVRKLEVANRKFFEENHLQGAPTVISVMYGIFYKDEMLGAVSFGPHHQPNQKGILSLNRLAFKAGCQVVAGATKLVMNALREINSPVVTWSDNQLTTGHLYEKMGFTLTDELPVDYSYTDGYHNVSKRKFRVAAGENETAKALEAGYVRYWNCGKKRWEWTP